MKFEIENIRVDVDEDSLSASLDFDIRTEAGLSYHGQYAGLPAVSALLSDQESFKRFLLSKARLILREEERKQQLVEQAREVKAKAEELPRTIASPGRAEVISTKLEDDLYKVDVNQDTTYLTVSALDEEGNEVASFQLDTIEFPDRTISFAPPQTSIPIASIELTPGNLFAEKGKPERVKHRGKAKKQAASSAG